MLKILQARLQQYVNHVLPDVQTGFIKRQRNQRSNCQHLLDHRKSNKSSRKTSTSALLTKPKPLTLWTTTNWKILKEMGIPDHLTCLLRNLYAVAQRVKHLPAMWETRVQSLGREDPLEKEMATHSSTHAWKIPWMEKPGGLQSMGSQRVGHD